MTSVIGGDMSQYYNTSFQSTHSIAAVYRLISACNLVNKSEHKFSQLFNDQ